MKKIHSLLILFIIPSILTAQINDTLKLRHHEIGINVTSLINELIPGGTNEIELSPYLVAYNLTGRHHALRLGLGLSSNSGILNDTIIILSHSSFAFNARICYE